MDQGHVDDIPSEAGKTSFELVDPEVLFTGMGLRPGHRLLDLGCGPGRYSLAAARRVGPQGEILALDLWPRGIELLKEEAGRKGLAHIKARVGNITSPELEIEGEFDLVLLATVLHDLVERGQEKGALANAARAVKHGGKLAVVEFVKKDGKPGPPKPIRLSPEQVAALAGPHGFGQEKTLPLGDHLYLSLLEKS